MDESREEFLRKAALDATSGNVAQQIHEAIFGPLERALVEHVDPNHPANTLHDMAEAVESAVRDATESAVRDARREV